jgi:hypothetical protein
VSIDLATRTEELAQDLARYPRITLARFIAERFMEDARRGAFGNVALKAARAASRESFALFASDLAAADAAAARERRRQRIKAEAERRLAAELARAGGGSAP